MSTSSNTPWSEIDQGLRRLVASARAARGMSWEQVAKAVGERGWEISAGNLMTRHSRMAFRADEMMLLLDVLGVRELPIQVPQLIQS